MRRVSLTALLTIALLAGFTARALFFTPSYPAGPANANANPGIGEAFYARLNDALAGGEIEPLAALLAGIFRDHDADTGATRTAAEFLDDVRAMGATPQLRLQPISLETSGDSLVVSIVPRREEPLLVAAMTVVTGWPAPHFETLRVVQGKIVDRWAPAIPWIEVSNAGAAAIPLPALTEVSATLMRVTLSGGMAYTWNATSAGVLTIESGTGRWTAPGRESGADAARLGPGDFVTFTDGAQIQLQPVDGPVTVLLFVTTLVPPADVSQSAVTLTAVAQGVTQTVLWSGPFSASDAITRYRPGRIVVPANTTLELRHAQGIDAVLAIDGGVLDLWAPESTITLLGSNLWPQEHTGAAQLDAGHAGAIVAPQAVTLQNRSDQPITVLVIGIERTTIAR